MTWIEWLQDKYTSYGGLIGYLYEHVCYARPLYEMIKTHTPPPRSIVDIGCGTAIPSVVLAGLGYRVLGVAVDKAMIQEAEKTKSLFTPLLQADVSFRVMDAFKLELPDKTFDIAFSSGTVEHFTWNDQIHLLKEHKRIAEHVVVSVPTRHIKDETPVFTYPHTPKTLRRLCKSAGLNLISQVNIGVSPGWIPVHMQRWVLPPKFFVKFLGERYAVTTACLCR